MNESSYKMNMKQWNLSNYCKHATFPLEYIEAVKIQANIKLRLYDD